MSFCLLSFVVFSDEISFAKEGLHVIYSRNLIHMRLLGHPALIHHGLELFQQGFHFAGKACVSFFIRPPTNALENKDAFGQLSLNSSKNVYIQSICD